VLGTGHHWDRRTIALCQSIFRANLSGIGIRPHWPTTAAARPESPIRMMDAPLCFWPWGLDSRGFRAQVTSVVMNGLSMGSSHRVRKTAIEPA
jgi:hypothetical protein